MVQRKTAAWDEYHEASCLSRFDWEIFSVVKAVNADPRWRHLSERPLIPVLPGSLTYELPVPPHIGMSLSSAIERRVSTERFGARPLSSIHLASVLQLSSGSLGRRVDGQPSHAVPSAGGMNATGVVVEIRNSDDFERGIYAYEPALHRLIYIAPSPDTLEHLFNLPVEGEPSTIVWIVASMQRLEFKYGERSYRFVLLEAGHIAQNILLVSTAMDLQSRPVGGFADHAIHDLVRAAEFGMIVTYSVALGTSDAT
jgi:SagB-type dehydrogenase family enzyme